VFDTAAAPDGRVFLASGRDSDDRSRTIVALREEDGKEAWSSTAEYTWDYDHLFLDPRGRLLAVPCRPDEGRQPYQTLLLDAGTRRPEGGLVSAINALGVDADRWLGGTDEPNRGVTLWERGRDRPVLALTGDGVPGFRPVFSHDGTHVAWGNSDGSVTVCDLTRIKKKLEEIGLGW
jgi:hypothetical protein